MCLRDPYERGERAHLNLGHTFAHALEAASDYTRVAWTRGRTRPHSRRFALSGLDDEARAVEDVLAPEPVAVDRDRAWAALQRDKKAIGGRVASSSSSVPASRVVTSEIEPERRPSALDSLIA